MNDPSEVAANDPLANATVAFGLSLAITSVASALLVIAKEKGPPAVMAAMKSATGHHWATHSLAALVLFLALGFALMSPNGGRGVRLSPSALVKTLVLGVAIGTAVIGGFYLFVD
jgi:hypothetical protein